MCLYCGVHRKSPEFCIAAAVNFAVCHSAAYIKAIVFTGLNSLDLAV